MLYFFLQVPLFEMSFLYGVTARAIFLITETLPLNRIQTQVHFILVKSILLLINKNLLISCANITGGGLRDNLSRIIPRGKTAEINLKNIKTFKIFKWLKKSGVSEQEMLKTSNCGIGFCLIVKKNKIKKIQKIFPKKFKPYIIGKIKNGKNKVVLNEKISW